MEGSLLRCCTKSAKRNPNHWTNGDMYTGDWREGVPHGHGEFVFGGEKQGDKYIGQYDKVRNRNKQILQYHAFI